VRLPVGNCWCWCSSFDCMHIQLYKTAFGKLLPTWCLPAAAEEACGARTCERATRSSGVCPSRPSGAPQVCAGVLHNCVCACVHVCLPACTQHMRVPFSSSPLHPTGTRHPGLSRPVAPRVTNVGRRPWEWASAHKFTPELHAPVSMS